MRGKYHVLPSATVAADRSAGRPDEVAPYVQSFAVAGDVARNTPVDRITLVVEDNHGEELFTCIYHPVLYGDS